ncbi:DNA-binding protein [[Mycobacterium] zoologicum]|uniref:DNA-binding protein n=1 Tax=[Mycobacterium] zoologicum TaxID=2872311 RepID=UPI002CECC501|nr:DNA-binding protein [Mycolicibacter sp. MYC101]MEB3065534.1 DNA-binding protein [Mycolicibacter sp. MYC101]
MNAKPSNFLLSGDPISDHASDLSPAERDLLAAAGFVEDPDAYAQVIRDTAAHAATLITTAASEREVAAALGVSDTRLRQLRTAGKLWAIDNAGTWVYPALQFERAPQTGMPRQIRGIDQVLAALPRDLHPLSVAGFLRNPQPDLAIDGQPSTPLDWLRRGHSVAPVLQLVEVLAWAGS